MHFKAYSIIHGRAHPFGMKRVDQTVVAKNKHPDIYNLLDQNAVLANNLYNAVLFRIRQVFTGWDKTSRTANEAQVFCELEQTEAVYPKLHIRKVLTWRSARLCRKSSRSRVAASLGMVLSYTSPAIRTVSAFSFSWISRIRSRIYL